jgi:hypothetical protein
MSGSCHPHAAPVPCPHAPSLSPCSLSFSMFTVTHEHLPARHGEQLSAGNWAGPGQPGPSPSCFVPNGFGSAKPKRFLGRAVLARSVKTVVQPGPKPRRAFFGSCRPKPGSYIWPHKIKILQPYCRRFETGGPWADEWNVAACPSPDGSARDGARRGERRRAWEVEIPRPSCLSRAQVGCACSRGLQASAREGASGLTRAPAPSFSLRGQPSVRGPWSFLL